MNDRSSFVEKMKHLTTVDSLDLLDEPDNEERASYSIARGVRSSIPKLEFRFKNGNRLGLDYSWLAEIDYDPSKGIVLDFDRKLVSLHGLLLEPLYDGLLRHRVLWVQELDHLVAAGQGGKETCVTKISVSRPKPGDPADVR